MTKSPHNFSKELGMPTRVDKHGWLYFTTHFPSEAWMRGGTFAFPALSCYRVLLVI